MPTDLDAAWDDLHDATAPGWYVGCPSYDEGRGVWEQYAFDPSECAHVGVRSRERTVVAETEVEVMRGLARCLRLIREGRRAGLGPRTRPHWALSGQPPMSRVPVNNPTGKNS